MSKNENSLSELKLITNYKINLCDSVRGLVCQPTCDFESSKSSNLVNSKFESLSTRTLNGEILKSDNLFFDTIRIYRKVSGGHL